MKTEVKIQEVPKMQACHIHISALLICCGKRVDKFTYTMSMKNFAKKIFDTDVRHLAIIYCKLAWHTFGFA